MLHRFHPFLARHERRGSWREHLKSTAGAVLGVMVVGALAAGTGLPLLMAPLGPTALLQFSQPQLPSSQPVNIFAGYFLGAVFASLVEIVAPQAWWLAALAVGATMLAMLLARVTHAPAAAVPLVIQTSHMSPPTLFAAMLGGCVLLSALAVLWHRLPPRQPYPLPHRRPDV